MEHLRRVALLLGLVGCGEPAAPDDVPAPSAPVAVSVTPTVARVGETLRCAARVDGADVPAAYRWSRGPTLVGVGPARRVDVGDRPGDTLVCVAERDGAELGRASARVVDAAPIVHAEVVPAVVHAGDIVACAGFATDPDGGTATLETSWWIGAQHVGDGPTWPVGRGLVGAAVDCRVRATDAHGATGEARATARVVDAPPEVVAVRVTPATLRRGDVARCDAEVADADGDAVRVDFLWLVDGVPAEVGPALAMDATIPVGADLVCVATATDDAGLVGEGSAWAVLEDTPPQVTSVTVTPDAAEEGDTLACAAVATDVDGDVPTLAFVWRSGDVEVGEGPVHVVSPSDAAWGTITCAVVATDPWGDTADGAADARLTCPSCRAVDVVPAWPRDDEPLRCRVPDAPGAGDLVGLAWTRDGVPVDVDPADAVVWEGDVVAADRTRPGEVWTCTATWDDGTSRSAARTVGAVPIGGNVLVIVADDFGVDKLAAFGAHPTPPRTPNLDALAGEGVLFRRAYGLPSCSPTRAALLTGRHGRRTGIGRPLGPEAPVPLSLDELVLPGLLRAQAPAYTTLGVGKWHLSLDDTPEGRAHPNDAGFDHYVGRIGNLGEDLVDGSGVESYTAWNETRDGAIDVARGYLTTRETDVALELLGDAPEPWFLYVAFHAPHEPLHVPPAALLSGPPPLPIARSADLVDAAIEAMDTEIGRLLAGLDPDVRARTTVVFLGDNGTSVSGTRAPWSGGSAKGNLTDGGTHVPLIVTGPAVASPGRTTDALVHVTDVFATVAEIAGARVDELYDTPFEPGTLVPWPLDGQSFLDVLADPASTAGRSFVFGEKFAPNHPVGVPPADTTVRDRRWRLVVDRRGDASLFDLGDGWFEGPDQLAGPTVSAEAQGAADALRRTLDLTLAIARPEP